MASTVREFMDSHPRHTALRAHRADNNSPMRPQQKQDAGSGTSPLTPPADRAEPRAVPVSAHPVKAKFERGTWFYLTQQRRPNGRLCGRWYPAMAFDTTELASDEFSHLRASYVGGLDPAEAAAVLAVHCIQCREDMED